MTKQPINTYVARMIQIHFVKWILHYSIEFDHTACNLICPRSDASWDMSARDNATKDSRLSVFMVWLYCLKNMAWPNSLLTCLWQERYQFISLVNSLITALSLITWSHLSEEFMNYRIQPCNVTYVCGCYLFSLSVYKSDNSFPVQEDTN